MTSNAPSSQATSLTVMPGNEEMKTLVGLFTEGRYAEVAARAQTLTERFPLNGLGWKALGVALRQLGRSADALSAMQQAATLLPKDADAHFNLGLTLHDLGRLEEAAASYRMVLKIEPNYADAHNNLGNALHDLGRLEEVEACYRRALQIKPDFAEAHNNLGGALKGLGRLNEAEASFRRALQIKSDYAEAHHNLGATLNDLGRLGEAEASLRHALKIKQDYAEAHCSMGAALKGLGRLTEAEASYQRALQIRPDFIDARSKLLFLLNFISSHAPSYYLAEARRYGLEVSKKVTWRFAQWSCATKPERLRVGLVSGDFCNHPVGYILESLLPQLDSTTIELVAYPTSDKADELTGRLKPHFSAWRSLSGQSDEAAARLIHGDGIHVLVDLSGHTNYNRLPVFAWKPAPVQISWLGYFATTGVSEIDYLLGDHYVTPTNEADHFTETIWQLPDYFMCFTAPGVALEVGPLPAIQTGGITFGCFNNLTKMTDAVVEVWAKILRALPASKLFLKAGQLGDILVREATLERFANHGIATDRLIVEGASPRAEYLAAYRRVDIALDPFPYPGGMTSIEGLWMGVPVITKRGDRFLSHNGESIAHNAGMSDWIASDDDDYITKAIARASDVDHLSQLRARLRRQVLASPLFDAQRFVRHFEEALWEMWNRWIEQRLDNESTNVNAANN